MRVLLLASRELTGPMTGRKQVLRTIVESLALNGCETLIATFGGQAEEQQAALAKQNVKGVQRLHRPGLLSLGLVAPFRLLFQGMSGNEGLFYKAGNIQQLKQIVQENRIDFVIADMLRLAPYASALGKPWHLDLDDLLSQRYTNLLTASESNDQLLGYYGSMLPSPARAMANYLARSLLPVEAKAIRKREILWAKQANSVSLVSPTEATRFSEHIGQPVHCLPMRAQFPPNDFIQPKRERSLVFLGGLDYQPNLDALRYYRDQILPLIMQSYPEGLPLHVIGKAPDKIRAELASPHIHLHGYVNDLTSELCKHAIFFAPITHGTGIKTKVLDAMGHALPVITTSKGIEGMGAVHEKHCLVGNTPVELAAAIRQCLEHSEYAEQLAQAGAAHIRQNFSSSVLAEKWAKVLAGA